MKLDRRTLLTLISGAFLTSWLPRVWSALLTPESGGNSPLEAIAPYLDTLLPAHAGAPSAVDVGVPARLLQAFAAQPNRQQLLINGGRYLNHQAELWGKPSFLALGLDEREAVVEEASVAEWGSFPRVFFEITREAAMRWYYMDPRTWVVLGFDGPPQPIGFLDHESTPVVRKD